MNQVECHPYHAQRELREYCAREGIVLQAYSSLGGQDAGRGVLAPLGGPRPPPIAGALAPLGSVPIGGAGYGGVDPGAQTLQKIARSGGD